VNHSQSDLSQDVVSDAKSLVQQGVVTPQAFQFVNACLLARLNLAISGPSQSENARLLRALASCLPSDEQILVIQNQDETPLRRKGVTTLRAGPQAATGNGVISRSYLLTLVPKIHPQRLLIDAVQPAEVLALLQVLFGMDGVMFSMAADSPADALCRLEAKLVLGNRPPRLRTARRLLANSLDLIIHLQTSRQGASRVVGLAEVSDVEDDAVVLRDVFAVRRVEGEATDLEEALHPTGHRPEFLDRMQMLGISLPAQTLIPNPKENEPVDQSRPTSYSDSDAEKS
jgi:pilus assembly protein CpaF